MSLLARAKIWRSTEVLWRNMAAILDKGHLRSENGLHQVARTGDGPEEFAPRFDHAVASVKTERLGHEKVFVFGGLGKPAESPSLDVHMMDEKRQRWEPFMTNSTKGGDPIARGCHAAAAIGSSIFLIGGYGGGRTLDEVLELDTETKEWRRVEATGAGPGAISSAAATAVGDKIYIIGGSGDDHKPSNAVHILDTKRQCWLTPHVLGDPPPARCAHTATLIGNAPSRGELGSDAAPLGGDRILVFGGYGGKPLGDAWILEVATPYVKEHEEKQGGPVVAWSQVEAGDLKRAPDPRPVVICGPSGVGKGTLINRLMAEFPEQLGFSVSHTTRKPRAGEQNGVHYNFTEKAVFEREIDAGKFLEYAHVHDNIYGTSIAAVQAVCDAGRTCILDIDVQGAQLVKNSALKALFVFILPPSEEELERRLRGRGSETEEQVQKRLRAAKAEMARARDRSLFDHTLVNDDLDKCYQQLKELLGLIHQTKELPGPRSGHTATSLGDRVVVYGGIGDGPSALSDVHLLQVGQLSGGAPDTTGGLQSQQLRDADISFDRAFKPAARYNHKAVGLLPSRVLLVGGYDGEKALGDMAILNLTSLER